LTLLDDKSYHFTEGGSVIAFALKGRVALALGDPIGSPEDIPGTIESFCTRCARNDWQPAFYQTMPETLDYYHTAGFETLCIGQEGIVDLGEFTLEGRVNKGLRSGYNRLKRMGFSARVILPPLDDELLQQLRLISDEWLAKMHGSEKRFSLGWFDNEYIRCGPVITIDGPDGVITAFANIVPEYQLKEVSIDLMRHRRQVDSGTMDFLLYPYSRAEARDMKLLNPGLSALGIGESAGSADRENAAHIYEHVDRFYNLGLHEYEKFHRTGPRYLVYPSATSLPAVALAIVRADSGDGLLSYLKH
jgi:phosphatidylglycerol lysyltransferase